MDPERAFAETVAWDMVTLESDVCMEVLVASAARKLNDSTQRIVDASDIDITDAVRTLLLGAEAYIQEDIASRYTPSPTDKVLAVLMLEVINAYRKSDGKDDMPRVLKSLASLMLVPSVYLRTARSVDYMQARQVAFNEVKMQHAMKGNLPIQAVDADTDWPRPEVETRAMQDARLYATMQEAEQTLGSSSYSDGYDLADDASVTSAGNVNY